MTRARSAYLLGHLVAELVASMLAIAVLTGSGLIIGWHLHPNVPHAVAGFALLTLLSFTMIWIGTMLGVVARSPDAVQGAIFLVVFPLTFISGAFVPLAGLPSGLRAVADYNPITAFAAAVRALFGNPTAIPYGAPWPLGHSVLVSVTWCAVLLSLAIPATLWAFRQSTTD